jgi:hypothetical protein
MGRLWKKIKQRCAPSTKKCSFKFLDTGKTHGLIISIGSEAKFHHPQKFTSKGTAGIYLAPSPPRFLFWGSLVVHPPPSHPLSVYCTVL